MHDPERLNRANQMFIRNVLDRFADKVHQLTNKKIQDNGGRDLQTSEYQEILETAKQEIITEAVPALNRVMQKHPLAKEGATLSPYLIPPDEKFRRKRK